MVLKTCKKLPQVSDLAHGPLVIHLITFPFCNHILLQHNSFYFISRCCLIFQSSIQYTGYNTKNNSDFSFFKDSIQIHLLLDLFHPRINVLSVIFFHSPDSLDKLFQSDIKQVFLVQTTVAIVVMELSLND